MCKSTLNQIKSDDIHLFKCMHFWNLMCKRMKKKNTSFVRKKLSTATLFIVSLTRFPSHSVIEFDTFVANNDFALSTIIIYFHIGFCRFYSVYRCSMVLRLPSSSQTIESLYRTCAAIAEKKIILKATQHLKVEA